MTITDKRNLLIFEIFFLILVIYINYNFSENLQIILDFENQFNSTYSIYGVAICNANNTNACVQVVTNLYIYIFLIIATILLFIDGNKILNFINYNYKKIIVALFLIMMISLVQFEMFPTILAHKGFEISNVGSNIFAITFQYGTEILKVYNYVIPIIFFNLGYLLYFCHREYII